ncbi:hypothetical protein [Youxingia wuxianensis]|nr:hypothetical protein [Youxingia wuxianensis]
MTFAQFKRMKPVYQRRLVIALLIVFVLFLLVLFAISAGVNAIKVAINTTTLEGVTASNLLSKTNMNTILSTMKQENASEIMVMDSSVVFTSDAVAVQVEMNLVNIVDDGIAENWTLVSDEKKTKLRKVSTEYTNMKALKMRKVPFSTYFPSLERIPVEYLVLNFPLKDGGRFTFTDNFGNNLEPDYAGYITEQGLLGMWVSKIGAVSTFGEEFTPVSTCVPFICSIEEVNSEKSKGKKVVLLEPEDAYVVLLEASPY